MERHPDSHLPEFFTEERLKQYDRLRQLRELATTALERVRDGEDLLRRRVPSAIQARTRGARPLPTVLRRSGRSAATVKSKLAPA